MPKQYDILYWDYLNNLYIKLNAQRDRINLAHVYPNTSLHNYHYAQDIIDLNNGINALQANYYLKSVAISNEAPTKDETLITPYYFNKIDGILDTIANTCIHNPCDCDCDCDCDCSYHSCRGWCHCDHYDPSGDCYNSDCY